MKDFDKGLLIFNSKQVETHLLNG